MINMIVNSFKFNNAYNKNAFIYRLRKTPIIGKYIPNNLYHSYLIDILINIVFFIYSFISPFIGKFIYILLMVALPVSYFNSPYSFINIFTFLTIIGGFCNCDIFNPSKKKYYSIVLMRMNTKRYVLSSLLLFLFKMLISFYPTVILFGYVYNVNIFILILLPIFVLLTKLFGNYILLMFYEKKNIVLTENNTYLVIIVSIIGLSLAYLLPFSGYSINYVVFLFLFIIFLLLGIVSLKYILKYSNYNKIYKKMLNLNNVVFNASDNSSKNVKKQYYSKIENIAISSDKKGYEYFNDIFIKRHQGILTKSAIKFALIISIVFIIASVLCVLGIISRVRVNNMILTSLPYFVFIMYFINRGSVITQAMFINCDHSMLVYRFYRLPFAILKLFRTRLKVLIRINLIPAIVVALGLPILLAITGGSPNGYNYVLLFVSIICLSIFFSVHHLVLYYLLQPYDINMKARSNTYSFINGITYFICYMCIDLKISTTIFAIFVTFFTVLYVLISLILVYKYAPKTFKLK